jgi:hypothetical protein
MFNIKFWLNTYTVSLLKLMIGPFWINSQISYSKNSTAFGADVELTCKPFGWIATWKITVILIAWWT